MLRSLVCAAAIFFLLVSVCLIPQNALARRCPVKMPETLLSLYQNSDSIYIAAYDRLEEGKVIEDTEDYTSIGRKKHFIVSTTLKGDAQKFFVLEDVEYRYKERQLEVAEEAVEPEEPEAPADTEKAGSDSEAKTEPETTEADEEVDFVIAEPQLTAGDAVLLFVRKGSDEGSPQLTDYRDGLKKLSPERLATYEKRINELNGIFAEKKVSHERLLEWLIRCAQDPLTRWEGTYELLSAVQQLEWQQQSVERRRERIANGEPVEEVAPEPAEGENEIPAQGRRKNIDTTVFAKMIDPNQKQLLADILLYRSTTAAEKSQKQESVRGDHELIELIKRWGDPRLLNFLLDSLRAGSGEPYYKAATMETIAELLDDDEAELLADKYQEVAWEDETDIVGQQKDEEEPVDEAESETDQPPANTDGPPEVEDKAAPETDTEAPETDGAPAPKKQTNKELRDELMQKFLARCDKVAADREKEKSADAAH